MSSDENDFERDANMIDDDVTVADRAVKKRSSRSKRKHSAKPSTRVAKRRSDASTSQTTKANGLLTLMGNQASGGYSRGKGCTTSSKSALVLGTLAAS